MKENLTDEIIERAIKGDRAAYDVIYRSCEGSIRSYITSHLNDKSQVDDVLQNTFISVYNNISRLRSPEGFKKWIFTIAYNECMSVNNNVKKQQQRFTSMNVTDEDGTEREFEDESLELPEDYATNKELQKLLADELNALTSKQRDCLILYYYKHKSIPEIAKMYGLSESAIKNRKEKAIEKLKRRLEKYRGRYNFAFVPLGGLMGKLVGTGKVKSAYLGTAVVKSATAGVVAAAVIGVAGFAGVGYLNYMGEKHDYSDKSIVIEEKSDSENDILKEYEMPDELKNLDWTEYALSADEPLNLGYYLINKTAEKAVLCEDGIPDYKLLLLKNRRFLGNKIQFVYQPMYSSPLDYINVVPYFEFEPKNNNFHARFMENQYQTKGVVESEGQVYIEDGYVIFSFEHILEDIPETEGLVFQIGKNISTDPVTGEETEKNKFIFSDSEDISNSKGFSISTRPKPDLYPDMEPEPERQIYSYPEDYVSTDDEESIRVQEEAENFTKEQSKIIDDYYSKYPEYMYCYTGNNVYSPAVSEKGGYTYNMNGTISYNGMEDDGNYSLGYFLQDDGSITLTWYHVPKIYLGTCDENGEKLSDPYGQVPYNKIKKINVDYTQIGEKPHAGFESTDEILYNYSSEIKGYVYDEYNNEKPQYGEINKRILLWLPPDTHYDELRLPDHLTGYYSDEALQRLNADHIYLGADSEGFVQQLDNSSDEKSQAILAQIRADNDI